MGSVRSRLAELEAELHHARASGQAKLDRTRAERNVASERARVLGSALRDLERRHTEAGFAAARLGDATQAMVQNIDWLDGLDLDDPDDVGALARLAAHIRGDRGDA